MPISDPALQRLVQRAQIKDLVTRSAVAIDRGETPSRAPRPPLRAFHFIWNQGVTLDQGTAEAETYVSEHQVYPEEGGYQLRVRGLLWRDQLQQSGTGWRIEQRTLELGWRSEQPSGLAVPTRRSVPQPQYTPTLDTDTAALEWLRDREAIAGVIAQYSRGIYTYDPQMIAGCFDPNVQVEYAGRAPGAGIAYIMDVIAGLKNLRYRSQIMGTQLIVIQGESAQIETYAMTGQIGETDKKLGMASNGVRYMDTLRKRESAWLITHRVHSHDFNLKNLPVKLG